MTAKDAQKKLQSLASPEIAKASTRFFKTAPGQYGAGDIFIGIRIPTLRTVVREFRELALKEVEILLRSPIHEERMLGLLVLVQAVIKADDDKRKQTFDCYVKNLQHVNNWDLVDSSAPAIVGGYLIDKSRKPLVDWARSKNLWERRVAIVATQHFIRNDDFDDTLRISKILLADKEDLIHKASGWMLREVGKRHKPSLELFLNEHASVMPRTMLRYAIERFSPARRQAYLSGS